VAGVRAVEVGVARAVCVWGQGAHMTFGRRGPPYGHAERSADADVQTQVSFRTFGG
jgi:hypothetical protein